MLSFSVLIATTLVVQNNSLVIHYFRKELFSHHFYLNHDPEKAPNLEVWYSNPSLFDFAGFRTKYLFILNVGFPWTYFHILSIKNTKNFETAKFILRTVGVSFTGHDKFDQDWNGNLARSEMTLTYFWNWLRKALLGCLFIFWSIARQTMQILWAYNARHVVERVHILRQWYGISLYTNKGAGVWANNEVNIFLSIMRNSRSKSYKFELYCNKSFHPTCSFICYNRVFYLAVPG